LKSSASNEHHEHRREAPGASDLSGGSDALSETDLATGGRELLARLRWLLGPDVPAIIIGPSAAHLEREASDAGWTLLPSQPHAACVIWFGPGHACDALPATALTAAHLVVVCRGGVPLPAQMRLATCRPFRPARRIDEIIAAAAIRFGAPAPATTKALEKWKRTPLAPIVGARTSRVSISTAASHIFTRADAPALLAAETMRDHIASALMTLLGCGKLPIIGATTASAIVAIIASLLPSPQWPMALLALASSIACFFLEPWARRRFLTSDPREVVLDEVAGMSLALALLPAQAGLPSIAACFFLFRFFDVLKLGIHWIERRPWPGAVLWDDLLAGLYAGLLTATATAWLA
jgi:phosphatidylglycerophosphatase A